MAQIKRAAVIGAGTMGSGIASHLTNAGIPVVLLDVPSDGPSRNAIAEQAIQRLLKSPAFMEQSNAELITTGNVEDHLGLLADADWITEAVVERLEVKQSLYEQIDSARKPGSIVSSNTSTIPLTTLTRNMPDRFAQEFCITHFFNPVRQMRLLELVSGPKTRSEVVETLAAFCDQQLGKGVVHCKDKPGFLGNRVGVYAIQCAIEAAIELGLTVEEADAVMGRPMGFPKTGVFALYDLIGLDLMLDVVQCLRDALPPNDEFNQLAAYIPVINKLVEQGSTGQKGGGGFFRLRDGQKEAVDLRTAEYRPLMRPEFDAQQIVDQDGLRALLEHDSAQGRFASHVLAKTFAYAASLVPEVSDQLLPIDEAMKLGFNWVNGPFEMVDQLGSRWFVSHLETARAAVPELLQRAGDRPMYQVADGKLQHFTIDGDYTEVVRALGTVRLTDLKRVQQPLASNECASVWDVGDGVACVEFHTKANALVPQSMQMVRTALSTVKENFAALVIHNDGPHFSMGVNLQFVLDAAQRAAWQDIEAMLVEFQETCYAMKYAPFPVVGAPSGMSLGGGFEVLLHCDALYAHANTVAGLVETQVGLIPAGGGCKEMLLRFSADGENGQSAAENVFRIIGNAVTAGSPIEGVPLRFFRAHDQWVMNRDRVLPGAKQMALEIAANYTAPEPGVFAAGGAATRELLIAALDDLDEQGKLTVHDRVVGMALARVLVGGDTDDPRTLTERDLLELERAIFAELVQTPGTQARIEHTLKTGKPLRN